MDKKKNNFTAEIFKSDKRVKSGHRFIKKIDYHDVPKEEVQRILNEGWSQKSGYTHRIYETYVTRTHLMTKEKYLERYDTPSYCSPSSESYWSM